MTLSSDCYSRPNKIRIHIILQGLGAIFILSGTAIIFIIKNQNKMEHLDSPHAIVGMMSNTTLAISSLSGWLTYFNVFKLKTRKIHTTVTLVCFLAGTLATISGILFKDWLNDTKDPSGYRHWIARFILLSFVITISGPLKRRVMLQKSKAS
jgi:hypothetical protein